MLHVQPRQKKPPDQEPEETTDYAEATSNSEPDVTTAPGNDPAPSLRLP